MANRNGQGVGDIVGFGVFFEGQKPSYHERDLLLVGVAVSDDGFFDVRRRVFGPLDAGVGGGKEDGAEGFSDIHSGGDVFGEEKPLGGHRVGVVFFDELDDAVVDEFEPFGHGDARGFNQAVIDALDF